MATDKAAEKPVRFLIVDPKETISPRVQAQYMDAKKQVGNAAPSPVYIDTVRAAQGKISDRDFTYAAIFVNPAVGNPAWFSFVRFCHEYRAAVPVFVIHEEKEIPKINVAEAKKLGLSGIVPKPLSYAKMYELMSTPATDAEMEGALHKEAPPQAKQSAEPEIKETDVVEVDLTGLAGRGKSSFDLYMRLSNKKYVKVLNAGDMLSADRIESYKAKGVQNVYLLKSAQNAYLEFYDKMVAELLKNEKVGIEIKSGQVASQGESALQFLANSGFSDASMQAAQQYVTNTTEVVQQIAAKNDKVQALLKDMASYEHSMAVTTMAGLVMKHIGGQSSVISSIGMACFLHDIALIGQPQAVLDEDESKMTPEQVALYRAHPEEGAKLVKKMKNVPPIVVTAVAQHHLRINKQGFPEAKAVTEVNLIAELIGLCHDFLKYVKTAKADPKINPIAAMKEKASKSFSAPLLDAFVRTFDEK